MVKKILIVDDSPISRRMLKGSLPKEVEFEIKEGSNGKEGVELYQEFQPDLTFLDLSMPVMSGDECLKEIKTINPDATVIVVSADVQIKKFNLIMELGAYMMMNKPISAEKMAKVFEKIN